MDQTLKQEYNQALGYTIIKAGYITGKKKLIRQGYNTCINPMYLENNTSIIHFNNFLKVWIVEAKHL
jgi:hypothetical protein